MPNSNKRRSVLKKFSAFLAAGLGITAVQAKDALNSDDPHQKIAYDVVKDEQEIPLFSSVVKHGGLLYVAGKGAHFEGDIKAHTDHVLKELEKALTKHGSSMDKVLKVNVYLADLADYHKMNEVFRGRFGENPPVRTTVATYGGVPGNSLVEMDCIAAA